MEDKFPEPDDGNWSQFIEVRGKYFRLSHRALHERELEGLEIAYSNTKNPIFAWKAILLFMMPFKMLLDDPDWGPWPTSLPKWCNEYLQSCASAVEGMSWGCDDPPSDCAAAIPALFGFTRKGWNAFNERRELRKSGYMERYYFDLRSNGVSAQQAMDETLQRYGLENERSVRRRFATYAKAYTPKAADQGDEGETS